MSKEKSINVLSLCDGISCGQIALERADIKTNMYYASEIEENAISITTKNFPRTIQLGDITLLNSQRLKELPRIDIVIGGTPCQDLSIAKVHRDGLEGKKSKLFWDYVRVLDWIRENNNSNIKFLFENVGSMKKKDEAIITKTLGVSKISINSNLFSAQNRIRHYWVNVSKNIKIPSKLHNSKVEDILEDNVENKYYLHQDYQYFPNNNPKSKTGMKFVCGIKSTKKWIEDRKTLSRNFPQGNRVYSILGKSACLTAGGGGLGGKTGLYYLEDGNPFSNLNIRRLTPLECERLQTLPDNYTKGLKDTNRYKCINNGWTVDVIAHIFTYLKEELL